MLQKIELQKEMDNALLEATKCSEALEELLHQIRVTGDTSYEMYKRVNAANDECKESMEKYLNAYRAYYSRD